tara:strand:+ start:929 stop:1387 length:459 start_codon:yes stop_codon:yes gene_type:complete
MTNIDINNKFSFNFKCTYQLINDTNESNILYRIQFLQFLNINEYNDKIVDNKLQILYYYLKNSTTNEVLINIYNNIYNKNKNIIDILLSFNGSKDNIDNIDDNDNKYNTCLYLLLNYDYFYLTLELLHNIVNNICTKNIVKKILEYIKNDIN